MPLLKSDVCIVFITRPYIRPLAGWVTPLGVVLHRAQGLPLIVRPTALAACDGWWAGRRELGFEL